MLFAFLIFAAATGTDARISFTPNVHEKLGVGLMQVKTVSADEMAQEFRSFFDRLANEKESGNFFYDNKGIISLTCLIVLSSILSGAFRQTKDTGIPENDDELEGTELWCNAEKMGKFAESRVATTDYMSVNYWSLFMNIPWYTTKAGCKWGDEAECAPGPDADWIKANGGKPWPAGETDTENAWAMITAYWSFMMSWKGEGARTCIVLSVLQGLVGPVAAQMFCWILDEIETGEARSTTSPLASLPGTSKEILAIWCVLLFLLYVFSIVLVWQYEMEVPEGGVVRQFKLRLQRKFVNPPADKAAAWPAGRCTGVLQFDVGQLIGGIWIAVFRLAGFCTSLFLIVAVVLWNNRAVISSVAGWGIFFAILFVGSMLDISVRREHLKDLAERKRDWICVEMAMTVAEVQNSRDGKKSEMAGKDTEHASFMSWYRGAHSFLYGLAACKACAGLNYAALGMITFVAGLNVMEGNMSMGQATALMMCMQLLAGVQASLVGTITGLWQAYPSLKNIAEVLNWPDN